MNQRPEGIDDELGGSKKCKSVGDIHAILSDQGAVVHTHAAEAVGQFALAALHERRNLLKETPAVIDRRDKKPK